MKMFLAATAAFLVSPLCADSNAARESLIKAADRALETKAVSVMDKTKTPPSGDKHDYLSQAPYWWPDPSKPNGLPYIRKDGVRNPEINGITDHTHMAHVAADSQTLALAWYFTGDEQ